MEQAERLESLREAASEAWDEVDRIRHKIERQESVLSELELDKEDAEEKAYAADDLVAKAEKENA